MSKFNFGTLLKEEDKPKPTVKRPKREAPPKPKPKPMSAPSQTESQTLEARLVALEAQLHAQEERQRLMALVGEMDSQGLALGMLFKALKDAKAQGTLKFKPRDFRDIQHLLGEAAFKGAWRYCLDNGIVLFEKNLTEEQMARLGVTSTTGGRYVCDYARLP